MNVSYPFIRRPIGTTLLAIGLFLAGVVAYRFLPVASLPAVELPTISVSASRPGADPETMAATIAAPLERRLGEIAGVTELTSRSSLGSTRITIQFDLSRNIDGAARDVQAALNAALTDLPGDLPNLPTFRKFNPAAAPVLILALTSKTIAPSAMYDIADSVLAQRISQTEGVGDVTVSGAEQPAVRVRVNPAALAMTGISMEQVRTAIANANSIGPLGAFDGQTQAETIATNEQLQQPRDYETLVVKAAQRRRGAAVEYRDGGTGRAQQPLGQLVQRPALGAADHHQGFRRQRHRNGAADQGPAAGAETLDPGRHRYFGALGPQPDHQGRASSICNSRCWSRLRW